MELIWRVILRTEMPVPQWTLGGKWHGDHADGCQPIRCCWTSQSKQERFSINGGQLENNDDDEEAEGETALAGCCKMTRILD